MSGIQSSVYPDFYHYCRRGHFYAINKSASYYLNGWIKFLWEHNRLEAMLFYLEANRRSYWDEAKRIFDLTEESIKLQLNGSFCGECAVGCPPIAKEKHA